MVMREAPNLAPTDSIARFLQRLKYLPTQSLPVLERGYLVGVVHQSDTLPIIAKPESERESLLAAPLSSIVVPSVVATPDNTPSEIGELMATHSVTMLPVVDEEGYCLGMVLASDLLSPDMPVPRPAMVGGMATPFGVYLTDGMHQAGAGNLALITSGVVLGLMFKVTLWATEALIHFGYHYGLPHTVSSKIDDVSATTGTTALMSIVVRLVSLLILLLLMRMTRLAGYHAAEHQTVHAIERTEKLTPDIVGRMPRAHPRCGTNIMAAGTLFFTLFQLASMLPNLDSAAPIVALIGTLVYWRPFGAILQERFTTRPASEKELVSGIKAGEDLLLQYRTASPTRTRLWKRIWCMGMVQNLIGVALVLTLTDALEIALRAHYHF